MTRKRILEIILAVLCIVFIPLALLNYARGKLEVANVPRRVERDPRFVAALQAGIALEQQQQYDAAFNKYMEAEFFASKMAQGKNDAFKEVVEHIVTCASASGDSERANNARKQIVRLMISSGIEDRDAGHFEEAAAKFQDAEQRVVSLDSPDAALVQDARVPLADALWKLGRFSDAEAVFARMASDVSQPMNDSRSVLGQKYMEIARIQSEIGDWAGAQASCQRAIQEFERTMSSYGQQNGVPHVRKIASHELAGSRICPAKKIRPRTFRRRSGLRLHDTSEWANRDQTANRRAGFKRRSNLAAGSCSRPVAGATERSACQSMPGTLDKQSQLRHSCRRLQPSHVESAVAHSSTAALCRL